MTYPHFEGTFAGTFLDLKGRTRMSLTQFAIVKAVAKDKPLKLSDGGGLHLLVKPGGVKLWRFRYRFAGRENTLAFGAFPAVSLAEARAKRDEARKLVADGSDPSVRRKIDRIAAAVQLGIRLVLLQLNISRT